MQFDDATTADTGEIRTLAQRSLLESYGPILSRETIEEAVDQWFDEDRLADLLDQPETVFVPTVRIGDELVAFAQCHLIERPERIGEIHWLHVDPSHRGKGIGRALLEHVRDRFAALDVHRLKGLVFERNEAGCAFFERNGFDLAYTHTQSVAGRTYTENVYVQAPSGESWRKLLEPVETVDGETRFIAYDEASVGSKGPFHVSYLDRDRTRRFGWFCSVCDGFDTAMDPMGRVVCNECGNVRKATRWDAAYLG